MKIELVNKDMAELTQEGSNYTIDYGYKLYLQDTAVKLKIETEDSLIVGSTCGCTTTNQEKTDTGYDVTLVYDSKRRGNFSKVITIIANQKLASEITLKGTIV